MLLGLACAVTGLMWALAHERRMSPVSDVLLVIGSVSVLTGAVVGIRTLSLSSTRRRRARRLARARSTESERDRYV